MQLPLSRSKAFYEYLQGQLEVVELLRASPLVSDQLLSKKKRQLANALNRGAVVLLSSHLERYSESLVVESIDAINLAKPNIELLPESLRLIQVSQPLRTAHETEDMEKKVKALKMIFTDYQWFWDTGAPSFVLRGEPLIQQFDNPLPERIRKLFRYLGIFDVVGKAVNLDNSSDRKLLEAKVKELVEKRNSIAHTGMTTDLTYEDVVVYLRCTRKLVRCIDMIVGQEIQTLIGNWPWV